MRDAGSFGEYTAARYLREHGCRITGANYRTRFGEIDIIAEKGRFLLFIEVKTRGPSAIGTPGEAVDHRKQQKLLRAAQLYLAAHPTTLQPRFDVIEIVLDAAGAVRRIRQIENAFEAQRSDF